jgi:hypothetical protein
VSLDLKQITMNEVGVPMYGSTIALRQLVQSKSEEAHIIRISPKGHALLNGVDYCYVGLKSRDGADYSIQAYGKEAVELYNDAMKLRF